MRREPAVNGRPSAAHRVAARDRGASPDAPVEAWLSPFRLQQRAYPFVLAVAKRSAETALGGRNVPLDDVDPTSMSEVIRDLVAVVG